MLTMQKIDRKHLLPFQQAGCDTPVRLKRQKLI